VSGESGPIFSKPLAARGMALGDFDNNGSVDVLVAINNGAPILLRNNVGTQNHWLGLRLVGKKANPDAIGARVAYQAADLKQSRTKVGGGSYLASHDPRMVLGLGKQSKVDWLEVRWPQPSGKTERFTELPVDRYVTIVEGEGKWK
jgi:enediyne biosynthesis protein E4